MKISLNDFTSRNLAVVNWLEGLDQAYSLMNKKGIRHLPVADDEGAIVGLISDRDFQRAMWIEQPDFASGRVAQPSFDPNRTVRDFMSWPVTSIDEKRSLEDAALFMLDKKISALLVTKNGDEVVGIITTEDMLRALLAAHESPASRAVAKIEGAIAQSPIGAIAQALGNAGI
ncbi:MAG: CBS domain-containing protein [Bdellovibrionaceae bacterium]|nr:CBS domain-containing protein [Pseudobdellovibrionaceae bacterium]